VVIHHGQNASGHYTAIVQSNQDWIFFNDAKGTKISFDKVNSLDTQRNWYMALYGRVDSHFGDCIVESVDDDDVVDDAAMVSFETEDISSKSPSSSQAKKQRTDVVDDAAMVSFETEDISASINSNQAFASQQKMCSCKGDCTSLRCKCRSTGMCSKKCRCCAKKCKNRPKTRGTIDSYFSKKK